MDHNDTTSIHFTASVVDASFLVILFCTSVVTATAVGWTVSGALGGWHVGEKRVDWLLLYLASICLLDAILDITFSLYTVTRGKSSLFPCRLSAAAAQWLSSQQAWLVCLLGVWHGGWLDTEKHPLTAVFTGCVSGAIAGIPILVGRTAVHMWPALMGCVVTAGDWCFYGAITSIWLYGLPCSAALLCFLVHIVADKKDQLQKEEDHVPNKMIALMSACFTVFFLPSIAVQQSLVDCSSRWVQVPWIVARIATWARYVGDTVLPCGIFVVRPDLRIQILDCISCNGRFCRRSRFRQGAKQKRALLLSIDQRVRETKPAPVVQSVSVVSFETPLPNPQKKRRKSYAYLSALVQLPNESNTQHAKVNALLWA